MHHLLNAAVRTVSVLDVDFYFRASRHFSQRPSCTEPSATTSCLLLLSPANCFVRLRLESTWASGQPLNSVSVLMIFVETGNMRSDFVGFVPIGQRKCRVSAPVSALKAVLWSLVHNCSVVAAKRIWSYASEGPGVNGVSRKVKAYGYVVQHVVWIVCVC